jgi:hypothetical protein
MSQRSARRAVERATFSQKFVKRPPPKANNEGEAKLWKDAVARYVSKDITVIEFHHVLGDGQVLQRLQLARRDNQPIKDWRVLQGIKNGIVGIDRMAVEVFPPVGPTLIDLHGLNVYHLWVMPEGETPPAFMGGTALAANPHPAQWLEADGKALGRAATDEFEAYGFTANVFVGAEGEPQERLAVVAIMQRKGKGRRPGSRKRAWKPFQDLVHAATHDDAFGVEVFPPNVGDELAPVEHFIWLMRNGDEVPWWMSNEIKPA